MIPDCTLVTCCFDLTKYNNKCRNVDECINNMKSLLEVPCYLIIFTDTILIEHIQKIRKENSLDKLTQYYIYEPEQLDTFHYLQNVKANREKYHPTKDERTCAESHLICCSKFELVLKSMTLNPFNTTKFGWMDANIGMNFSKICRNYKNNMLLKILQTCSPNKFHLQILNVCDKKFIQDNHLHEYYNQYRWVVCGSFFLTGKEIGTKILTELKNIFIKHTLLGYGHAEEMFYLEILERFYDDIEKSYGDYNTIINNFLHIKEGLDYVYMIATQYLHYGYYKECVDCCKKVIQSYENFSTEISYDLYFHFMFTQYIAYYQIDKEHANFYANDFLKKIFTNPLLFNEYKKNKHFYDTQFSLVL